MVSTANDVLFGRRPTRTRLTLGVACVLFVCMFLIGAYASGRWMQDVMGPQVYPVLFVLLVGGGLAIWNAYWNDGLFLSWLLLFALVTPWLLHFNHQYGSYQPQPYISAGYVTLALVVGTVGYLIGVGLRQALLGDADGGAFERVMGVLGSAPDESIRWRLVVSGLFVVPAVLVYVAEPYRNQLLTVVYPVVWFYPIGHVTWETVVGVGLVLGWLGLATWSASRGNGVLVSWGVIFAPIFGLVLSYSLLEEFWTPNLTSIFVDGVSYSPADDVTLAALVAVPIAVILGTLGFLIGMVLHRTGAVRRPDRDGMGA